MGKMPNFYAMSCDELADYMAGERDRTKKLLAKSKKTKDQIETLGEVEKGCKVVKNVSKPSVIERLRGMFSKAEE